jgi:hypothetical protein
MNHDCKQYQTRVFELKAIAQQTIPMKAYLITTGTVFGLIVLAHLWRVLAEGPRLATDPVFVLLTTAAAALSFWAWRLLGRSGR